MCEIRSFSFAFDTDLRTNEYWKDSGKDLLMSYSLGAVHFDKKKKYLDSTLIFS